MNACALSPLQIPAHCLRLPARHLPRDALRTLLLSRSYRLRLLAAPAGFGKSVLLAECARACPADCLVLWLDLGGRALVASELHGQLAQMLGYGAGLDEAQLLQRLSLDERHLWLMFDDFPRAPDAAFDACMERLLRASAPSHQWWLAGRRRPACNLPRLLLEGELLELGVAELSLNREELGVWLQRDGTLAPALDALYQQTAGWIAAARLLSLGAELPTRLGGEADALLSDYLEHEVFAALPGELRQALGQLAHIPRFNAALCEHLLGVGEGAAWLQALRERGLFIQPLAEGGWFSLFAPLARWLRDTRSPQGTCRLHLQASQWFASQGDIPAALEHALQARQPEVAASFLERFAEEQLLQGQDLPLLLRWCDELPASLLGSTPRLILLNAWVLLLAGRLDEARSCVDQLSKFQPRSDGPRSLELFAQWQAIQGIAAYGRGCALDSREQLQASLAGLPASAWAQALLCRSILTQVAIGEGDLGLAQQLSCEALKQARLQGSPVFEALLELDHALLLEARGELIRAEALLQRVLTQADDELLRQTLVYARLQLRLGRLAQRQGRAQEAEALLREGLQLACCNQDPSAFHGYLGLAELAAGQNDLAQAFALLAEGERLMQRQRVAETLYRGPLLLASSCLGLRQGHVERAREASTRVLAYARRVRQMLPPPNCPEMIARFQALLLRLDLQQGRDVRLALQQLLEQARSQGRQILLSDLLQLQAQACAAQGDQAGAAQARQAGQALARQLNYQCPWFAEGERPVKPGQGMAAAGTVQLSSRELAVLGLIAQGLSNQEVAERLFISLHTVKTHARRINGKLGVARRTQAVAQAKALGLL